MKLALLGAESTGKTALSQQLAAHWRAHGRSVAVVAEFLREWCEREGRTPQPHEQLPIAQEQERRVDAAAARADIVIADTTAVMVAIYSAMLFEDGSLYRFALDRLRGYDLVLLTGLDLPWVADGLQRDGPHVREPVDALVRAFLVRAALPWSVVYGSGEDRLRHALAAADAMVSGAAHAAPERVAAAFSSENARWSSACERCGNAECEHRLFRRLAAR